MSDIIYTPPASSGGGQNPTTNYIPLNNGTSNFVDSFIFNDKTNGLLYFTNDYGLTVFGLTCDNTSSYYAFGDFTNGGTFEGSMGSAYVIGDILVSLSSANKQEVINDGQNQIILTQNQNGQIGLKLDLVNSNYQFGDYNGFFNFNFISVNDFNNYIQVQSEGFVAIGDYDYNANNTKLTIDDAIQFIGTTYQGNDNGIYLDFANRVYTFGDISSTNNGTSLYINDNADAIYTANANGNEGINLVLGGNRYQFGDFSGSYNGTSIDIKDTAKAINLIASGGTILFSTDLLNFVGTLTSGSAGGNSGQHLQVTINGTAYKIALLNP